MSDKRIDLALQKFTTDTREEIAQSDSIYKLQEEKVLEAEEKYKALNLSEEAREIIEKYADEIAALEQRYADLSYLAGIKDALVIFEGIGVLK